MSWRSYGAAPEELMKEIEFWQKGKSNNPHANQDNGGRLMYGR